MKVLQILPELNAGGVERGTIEVAGFLAREGHESVVVSSGGQLVRELEAAGSRHLALPVHRKSPLSLRQVGRLRDLFRSEAPDIVHVRSRVPAWLAWLAWKKMDPGERPRFVSTMHGLHSVNAYSRIMTRGERVIAPSEAVRQYILEHFPLTDPAVIRVIPRGIDPAEYPHGFRPPASWLQTWYRDHSELVDRYVITLPARLTRLKGHEEFISLVGLLKQSGVPVHGLIVGGAHPRKRSYADEIAELVSDVGLDDCISFLGHRTDLREIMAVSDAVLSLNKKPEAFGRVTLEALAIGTPVVAYAQGGVAEQLRHFLPEGAISPGNLPAAAGLLTTWSRHGAPTPRPDHPFTLKAMLQATLKTYQELA